MRVLLPPIFEMRSAPPQCGQTGPFGSGLQQFDVAPGTAAVFRRTTAGGVEETRISDAWHGISELFDLDRVLPAITKIIDVSQRPGAHVFEHGIEVRPARVARTITPAGIGNAPADAAGEKLVEVAVGPSHRGLDDKMQTVEPDVEPHLDPAQRGGLDLVERDLEAGDGVEAHAARLRRWFSAAQRHGS